MALTRATLAVALRLTADESDPVPDGQGAVLDRVLSTGTALVTDYAPDAPADVQDEATIRVSSWLYDRPGHDARGGNPMVASGAAALLSRYRSRTVTVPGVAEVAR